MCVYIYMIDTNKLKSKYAKPRDSVHLEVNYVGI